MNQSSTMKDVNSAALQEITQHIDNVISLSQPDADLRIFCIKFQIEHAAAKIEYQLDPTSELSSNVACSAPPQPTAFPEMVHLKRVLLRMIDLVSPITQHILHRAVRGYRETSPTMASSSESPYSDNSSMGHQRFQADELGGVSGSVDEFNEHELRVEVRANIMHSALEVLSLCLIVHPQLCSLLQEYMVEEKNVVPHLSELMNVEKEVELTNFTEGFKTDVMKLVANLTFENPITSNVVAQSESLLNAILSATRIDEENPGMVEWAEFAIRNLCKADDSVRDHLRKLRPTALHPSTNEFLRSPEHHFDERGKLIIAKTERMDGGR